LNIQENVLLAPLTTLEVGGPARYFVEVRTETDVVEAFDLARSRDLATFVLGGGSNILVSDKGFDGLVIKIELAGIHVDGEVVTAAAGEEWDAFVKYAVGRELAGIECLSGIPGTVGGTPVQNVGAYGQEVSETIESVRCFDRKAGQLVDLTNEQCGFTYRTSIFNTTERDRYVVLSVTYKLRKNGRPKIAYKDLTDHFGGHEPSLAETRDAILSIRRSKSMVIDPSDPNRRSAGSFFKNPIASLEKFDEIADSFGGNVPHFPAGAASVKIPAAWLIERSGFYKGFAMGKAGISTNHTLAIINRGGAVASEIVELKNAIQKAVSERFAIDLVPEPIFVGDMSAKI
jgi:UDP-N-acetylmuramate dehydrogenase